MPQLQFKYNMSRYPEDYWGTVEEQLELLAARAVRRRENLAQELYGRAP